MIWKYICRMGWVFLGAAVSSVGIAMTLCANVGLEPWSVLQQGISLTTGITYGTASIIVGTAVIAIAVFFGESFGIGTVANILLCGIFLDWLLSLNWISQIDALWSGVLMLLAGLELLVLGTWMSIKSTLGVGPRDALMVALARKTSHSVGICRGVVDLAVVVTGWLLGGQVGIGTVISAFGLGSLFNLNFFLLRFDAAALHQENLMETVHFLQANMRKDL